MKKLILMAFAIFILYGCNAHKSSDARISKYPKVYSIQVKYLDGYCDTIEYISDKRCELKFIIKTFQRGTLSTTKISPSLVSTVDKLYEIETLCSNVRNFKIINKKY